MTRKHLNLKKIFPKYPIFYFTCFRCNKKHVNSGNGYVDLDGKAFKSFYCSSCASLMLFENIQERTKDHEI